MNKYFHIICALWMLLSSTNMVAQKIHYSEIFRYSSEKYSHHADPPVIKDYKIIGQSDGHIYTLRKYKFRNYVMDIFNDTLGNAREIKLDFLPATPDIIDAYIWDNKIVMLYSKVVKGNLNINWAKLNKEGAVIEGPIKIFDIKQKFSSLKKYNTIHLQSEDKSQQVILLYTQTLEKFIVLHLNKQFEIINQFELPEMAAKHPYDIIDEENIRIMNNGTIVLPYYAVKKDHVEMLNLLFINIHTQRHTITRLVGDEFTLNGYAFAEEKNVLHVAGVYKKHVNTNALGIYKAAIDVTENPSVSTKIYSYKKDFLQHIQSEKSETAMNDYVAKDLVIKPDGGFILFSEKETEKQEYYHKVGNVITHLSLDVVVTNYNNEGTVLWTTIIPKSQKGNRRFRNLSYTLIPNNSTLTLIYLSSQANKEITITNIDQQGGLTSHVVNFDDALYRIMFKDAFQLDKRNLLVPRKKFRNYGFVKVPIYND